VLFLSFAYEANPLRSCKPKLTRKRSMPKNDDTRTEEDSLGPIDVPAEALYGAQTQRAKENFPISDLRFPRRFIEALGIVKQAAARANR
jgi:hypothetical protein